MPRQILCAVETSLLTNHNDRPWAGWNPCKPDSLPADDAVDHWLRTADTAAARAEPNSWLDSILPKWTSWYCCTLTPLKAASTRSASKPYYSRVRETILDRIGKLGYEATQVTSGLKALVDAPSGGFTRHENGAFKQSFAPSIQGGDRIPEFNGGAPGH